MLQKTRKTTAKMRGLCEERSEIGRVGRKGEKRPTTGKKLMETNHKISRKSE